MNYKIDEIQKATLNNKKVKLFKAYEKRLNAFIFVGTFSAPGNVSDEDLWRYVEIDESGD